MVKVLLFLSSMLVPVNVFAKVPETYKEMVYNCKMACGELGVSKNCKGLEFSGSMRKDVNGEWVGSHDHFVFYPNNFEYHGAHCKASYVANLIPIDPESLKISFSKANYIIPQICSDGSSINADFSGAPIRQFSIYLALQNESAATLTFKSLASISATTVSGNNSGSPVCEVTFK